MTFNFYQLNHTRHGLNALSILALQHKVEEVNALLLSGGKLADAVYGYALGGHYDQLAAILDEKQLLVAAKAMGFARAGNEDETQKLMATNDPAIKKALLKGYAQAANQQQINAALCSNSQQDYQAIIVEGLAEAGHTELLEQYAINEQLQNSAISAAAYSGNVSLVTKLLALQGISLPEFKELKVPLALSHALIGFSKGRHFENLEPLLQLKINPMLCLTAIADTGCIHQSDIDALNQQVTDEKLQEILHRLIKEQFSIKHESGEQKESNSNERLDILFDNIWQASPSVFNP